LSEDEQLRRAHLARIAYELRRRGATLEAIGSVIDRDKRRVHELEKLGGALVAKLASLAA
jgi:hypothetical protein